MNTCVITGASTGLGLSLAQRFSENHHIINYDILEGQDLNLAHVRDSVCVSCQSARVFINNCQIHQLELLERVYSQAEPILIINISASAPTLWTAPWPSWQDYISRKQALDQRVRELQSSDHFADEERRNWIMNVRPGFMNTDQHRSRGYRTMDTGSVAQLIWDLAGGWPQYAVLDIMVVPSSV